MTIIIAISRKLSKEFEKEIPVPRLFAHPTISALAKYLKKELEIDKNLLTGEVDEPERIDRSKIRLHREIPGDGNANNTGREVAVIGMSCRFPGVKNIEEFWHHLKEGKETISFFSDEELLNSGVPPGLLSNPNFVKASSILEDKKFFDAYFFGYTPREAELLDPQIRIFHECSWEALEDSGIDPDSYKGLIGVYAGAVQNLEWEARALLSNRSKSFGSFAASRLTGIRYLCTRLSYNLNLKGPSITMQTACSTALVAIHMARQALFDGDCDVALAGGVSVSPGEKSGYLYEEGMIFSQDGHCRPFDAKATGTIFGEGAGVVILKPLEMAIGERDHIYAVIKSTAINNDGSSKVGFTAPGVAGQIDVIRAALQAANIEKESVSYIETHGASTQMGDPIEIEALKQTFHTGNTKEKFCKIGSVKSNFGHLDVAAGAAGFIKTVLSLKYRMIPPSLNFEISNPVINLDDSPFEVNTQLTEWKTKMYPLRAGVSSMGMGGTNAHIILEKAPKREEPSESRNYHMILLSAKSENSLNRSTKNLVDFLKKHSDMNLADVAYTLQVGRRAFQYRRIAVCSDVYDAIEQFSSLGYSPFQAKQEEKPVIFMFPGLGSQYVNMGLELYQTELLFGKEMDRCFDVLQPIMDFDVKSILYPDVGGANAQRVQHSDIHQIEISQVVVFIFEYALTRLLMQWGIEPYAVIGYSSGEYAAACIAGVFSLEEALKLMVFRGKLIQRLPRGAMLSVPLSEKQVTPLLNHELSLAIDNGESCIIAGSKTAVDAFEKQMKENHYVCMRLHHSYAIHSKVMDPILTEFQERVKQIPLKKPSIPYISNVTGNWITDEQATDPGYWTAHLRQTVRFSDGIKELIKESNAIFVEIGPGGDLSTLIRRCLDKESTQQVVNLVRLPRNEVSDVYYLLSQMSKLWLYGKKIDWNNFYAGEKRYRVSLPTYPFEGQRYWIDEDPFQLGGDHISQKSLPGVPADCFFIPSWKSSILLTSTDKKRSTQSCLLVFMHGDPVSSSLTKQLERDEGEVFRIMPGTKFKKLDDRTYAINPRAINHYYRLMEDLLEIGKIPASIVHLWNLVEKENEASGFDGLDRIQDLGFYSLLFLAQAIAQQDFNSRNSFQMTVVTNNMQKIPGQSSGCPEKATVLGFVNTISMENPGFKCQSIDIQYPEPGTREEEKLLDQLVSEIHSMPSDTVIALRGSDRLVFNYEPIPWELLQSFEKKTSRLKEEGVYLVTGGLEGVGFALAQYLARTIQAKLVLLRENSQTPGDKRSQNQNEDMKLKQLEDLGASVLILNVDVTQQEQIQEAVGNAQEKFGQINGVIHRVEVYDYAGGIMKNPQDIIEKILAPILKGTMVLERIFKDAALDFFLLCSSRDSCAGPWEQLGNAAASAFLQLFAHHRSSINKYHTVSLNWPQLQGVEEKIVSKKIEDVFNIILNTQVSQGVIELQGLHPIKKDKKPESLQTESVEETPPSGALYRRPELSSDYAAPNSDVEHRLTKIYQNFLGIEKIGILDDFFELGMDSLKTISVGIEIYKEFNLRIQIEDIFKFPNIKELSEYISRTLNKDLEPEENVDVKIPEVSHPENEVFIVERSWNIAEISNSVEMPENILLTGTTGYLGTHVLKELIDKTGARIYCLLRGDTSDQAFERGRKIWDYYFDGQFEEYYGKRIIVVTGDITKSHLDMEGDCYDDLAERVDTVIHSAADVRHYGRYDDFKKTNVNGTQRIIDFCFSGIEKKMHHISSLSVIGISPGSIYFKENDLDIGQSFKGHLYEHVHEKSKFEAEKLVYRARNHGLIASIYRLGELGGRYKDGVLQKNIKNNRIWSYIKAVTLMGQFPSQLKEKNNVIAMTPADVCSHSLVNLVLLKDALGYNFHLFNPHSIPYIKLIEGLKKCGFFLDPVDSQTFYNRIDSEIRSENFQDEVSISRMFYSMEGHENVNTQQINVTIDSTFTNEVLKKRGFSWYDLDSTYITKMIEHCINIGFITPPR